MKKTMSRLLSTVLITAVSSVAMADNGITTGPSGTTSTATVVTSAATAAKPLKPAPKIEVFSFTPITSLNQSDWTGRGIQENLQSDVSRTGATLVLPPHPLAPGEDPIAFAKANHADLAVSGSYQIVGNQIRVNGHVIDVASNTTVGGFAATGAQQDLFKVEDALGEQLHALLPPSATTQQVREAFEQQPTVYYSETAPTYTPPAAVNNYYDTQPVPNYYYPDNDYYPYNGGFYGGFGFSPGFFYGGGYGRNYNRGYYGNNRGSERGLTPNPSFNNPTYRGSSGGGHSSFGGGFGGGHGGGGHR